jgi:hypothetical protein
MSYFRYNLQRRPDYSNGIGVNSVSGRSRRAGAVLVLLLAATACAPMHTLHYTGDKVTVEYAGTAIDCELLAVTDSLVYVVPSTEAARSGVYGLRVGAIGEIGVHDYTDPIWLGFYVVGMVLPTAILVPKAMAPDLIPEFRYGILAFTTATGALLILGTRGNPEIAAPFNAQRLTELRNYARYPYEISPEQLTLLLRSYRQDAPLAYPTPAGSTNGKAESR